MKIIYAVLVLLLAFPLCGQTVLAKNCDEVLYVAYLGEPIISASFRFSDLQVDSVPYYFGAFCIDNTEKKLTYYPRREKQYLNGRAEPAVRTINSVFLPEMELYFMEKYMTKGEGRIGEQSVRFYVPKNTALFPYWVGEYIDQNVGTVFRRDVNAEPELDWVPNFTYSRPFPEFFWAKGEAYPDIDWTDDKGRSGP